MPHRSLIHCVGFDLLKELSGIDCVKRAEESLPYEAQNILREQLPSQVVLAGGRKLTVTYEADKPPWVQSYLQALFECQRDPKSREGDCSSLCTFLAPNRRAVQVTGDLPGFWDNHYPGLRQSLMRRYPKHAWPEDPRTASAPCPGGRRRR